MKPTVSAEPNLPETSPATHPGGGAAEIQTPREPQHVNASNVERYWRDAMDSIGDTTAVMATNYQKLNVVGENQLVVTLADSYNKQACDRPEKKKRIEEAFEATTGRRFRVDFEVGEVAAKNEQVQPVASRRQVMRELQQDPVLQKAIEEFDGEIIDFQKRKPK